MKGIIKLGLHLGLVLIVVIVCWMILPVRMNNPWQSIHNNCDKSVAEIYAVESDDAESDITSGTGFVIDLCGRNFIITNRHVASGAFGVVAMFHDEALGIITLVDASEIHDLALLEPVDLNVERYGALKMGSSKRLKIGEEVMTIGHPISESHHISVGFYTGKYTDDRGCTLLRLSMAVDPGNSGGPLLNRSGEVIGVVCQKVKESANIAFAIPIEKVFVLKAVDELCGN